MQAVAAGLAIASGGLVHDAVQKLAHADRFGAVLMGPATGYGAVYAIEIILLFATLVAIGPLAGFAPVSLPQRAVPNPSS